MSHFLNTTSENVKTGHTEQGFIEYLCGKPWIIGLKWWSLGNIALPLHVTDCQSEAQTGEGGDVGKQS